MIPMTSPVPLLGRRPRINNRDHTADMNNEQINAK